MPARLTLVSFAALSTLSCAAFAQDSELYVSGLNGKITVMRFGNKQRQFQVIGGQHQYGLAVADDVRTVHQFGNNTGALYTLNGAYQNVNYFPNLPLNESIYDGGTDGAAFNWAGSYGLNNGNVYRFDRNWGNITVAFNIGANKSITGITYDLVHQSLWTYVDASDTIAEYSTSGQLLSSFPIAGSKLPYVSLAYEPSTQTIWAHNWTENALRQYSRTGDLLQTVQFFGSDLVNSPSMEFSMTVAPAPSAGAVFSLCGLGLIRRRRRA